jgi:hypothetical protein
MRYGIIMSNPDDHAAGGALAGGRRRGALRGAESHLPVREHPRRLNTLVADERLAWAVSRPDGDELLGRDRACLSGRASPYVPTAVEPRYVGTSFSCFYDSNIIGVVSLNDFSGDVRLEVLSLPDWVRSQTATKG